MSFTKAAFQIHSIFQHYINIPYYVDIRGNCLSANPTYSKKSIPFWFAITTFLVYQPGFIYHLVQLFVKFKNENAVKNFDEITFYSIFSCLVTVVNASNFVIVTRNTDLQCFVSECCRLGNGLQFSSKYKIGRFTVQELIAYSMFPAFLTIPLTFFFVPLLINWDPIQLLFGTTYVIKISAAIFHGLVDSYIALLFLSTMQLLILVLENIQIFTDKKLGSKNTDFIFSYKSVRITQLLVATTNILYTDFAIVLVIIGILIASVGTFATLTLWAKLQLIMFIALPAISSLAYIITLLMTAYGDIPRKNGIRFHSIWKGELIQKIHRKMFQSIPRVIGFDAGPYGVGTAALGIRICDDMLRNAIGLILMF